MISDADINMLKEKLLITFKKKIDGAHLLLLLEHDFKKSLGLGTFTIIDRLKF